MVDLIQRRIYFLALIFIPLVGQSQAYFRFVDITTGQSVSNYDAEVIRNGYLNFAFIGQRNDDVYFLQPIEPSYVPKPDDVFFLSIDKRDYYPLWIEVDINSKDTLLVELEPDPNFQDEEKGYFHSWGGTPVMREYYPKPFRKWEEIPQEISEKIKNELISRIGEKAFSKIYISTAHIFETNRLNELGIPNNYAPNTVSYRICFSFSDRLNGIAQYTSESVFLDNGAVVVAPKFPEFWMWESEEKKALELKNQNEIRQKLKDEFGDSFSNVVPNFEFYPRGNTFSWVFSKEIGKTIQGETKSQAVYLDAISGEVLAVFYDKKMVFSH